MILKLLSIIFYYLGFGLLYALHREYIIHKSLKSGDYRRLEQMFNSKIHIFLGKLFEWIIQTKIKIDEVFDDEL